MEYTKLGQTDIKISKICMGCMRFGKAGTMHDWTLDEAATGEVVKHALDLGINFFDTANGYLPGFRNEKLHTKLPFDDLGKLYDFAALACIIREQLRQFLFIVACNAI